MVSCGLEWVSSYMSHRIHSSFVSCESKDGMRHGSSLLSKFHAYFLEEHANIFSSLGFFFHCQVFSGWTVFYFIFVKKPLMITLTHGEKRQEARRELWKVKGERWSEIKVKRKSSQRVWIVKMEWNSCGLGTRLLSVHFSHFKARGQNGTGHTLAVMSRYISSLSLFRKKASEHATCSKEGLKIKQGNKRSNCQEASALLESNCGDCHHQTAQGTGHKTTGHRDEGEREDEDEEKNFYNTS